MLVRSDPIFVLLFLWTFMCHMCPSDSPSLKVQGYVAQSRRNASGATASREETCYRSMEDNKTVQHWIVGFSVPHGSETRDFIWMFSRDLYAPSYQAGVWCWVSSPGPNPGALHQASTKFTQASSESTPGDIVSPVSRWMGKVHNDMREKRLNCM